MLKIHIQVRASEDLRKIFIRSVKEWGLEVAEAYYDELTNGIASLSENPEIGFVRDDIKRGYRQLAVGKHHIFYRITESKIRIVRVLHEKMLKNKHF